MSPAPNPSLPTPADTQSPDPLWTYQDLARRFQVCPKQIYRWFRYRPKFRLGNTVRIPESEVQKFIRHATRPPPRST